MKANCDWIEDLENGSEDDDAVKLVESRVEVVWSERIHADHLGVFVIVFVIVIVFVFVIVFVIVFVNLIVFVIVFGLSFVLFGFTISKMKEDRKISSA